VRLSQLFVPTTVTDDLPSEDTLRTLRYEEYLNKERIQSEYTVGSTHTDGEVVSSHGHEGEGGFERQKLGIGLVWTQRW